MSLRKSTVSFWDVPIPFLQNKRDKWLFIGFGNAFGAFFLLAFQPFGVNNYDPSQKINIQLLIGIGVFTAVNILLMTLYEFGLVPAIWRRSTRKTLAFRLLLLWLILGTSTFLTYNWLGNFHDWYWLSYLGFIRDIGMMLIIPVTGILLYFNQRQAQQQVEYLLQQSPKALLSEQIICLLAENGKDQFCIQQEHLLLLEAQDNYVAIFHLDQGQVKKVLIRSSLKKLEEQIKETSLLRCHRSYIVNTIHIQKVKGNAHQLQLSIEYFPQKIPVSRSYVQAILMPLDAHPV